MNILLTGASGMLGSALHSVCGALSHNCSALNRDAIDFRDRNTLLAQLNATDVLVHAAANTNVEQCELDPYSCYRDNTLLTEVLAAACLRAKVKFVYISSTGVYGAAKDTPYHEYDETSPTTHYHRSKLWGEFAAQRSFAPLVVRTGWLFGGSTANPKNFVAARLREASASHGMIQSNNQQRGNPTYVVDLATRLMAMICDDQSGVFNCVNSGIASRLDYVRAILESAGSTVTVEPRPATHFQRKADVSDNETAINLKLEQCLYEPMPDWRASLSQYVRLVVAERNQLPVAAALPW